MGGREAQNFIRIEGAFSEILEPPALGERLHPHVAAFLPLEALLPLAFFFGSQAGLNLEWCSWSVA